MGRICWAVIKVAVRAAGTGFSDHIQSLSATGWYEGDNSR